MRKCRKYYPIKSDDSSMFWSVLRGHSNI
jgi:hypothetical protein